MCGEQTVGVMAMLSVTAGLLVLPWLQSSVESQIFVNAAPDLYRCARGRCVAAGTSAPEAWSGTHMYATLTECSAECEGVDGLENGGSNSRASQPEQSGRGQEKARRRADRHAGRGRGWTHGRGAGRGGRARGGLDHGDHRSRGRGRGLGGRGGRGGGGSRLGQPSPVAAAALSSNLTSGTGAADDTSAWQSLTRVQLGGSRDETAIFAWLRARHEGACDDSTPVYFAPFSPNGIGNKVLAMVMAFHMALMMGRKLVVTDWPPSTLQTEYPLEEVLHPSSCQRRFDADTSRPKVKKCSVIACPLRTASKFKNAFTQPHWAHSSEQFLELPATWQHLSWPAWWRAITQFLFRPGDKLLAGLASELDTTTLTTSTPLPSALRRGGKASSSGSAARAGASVSAAAPADGFARRFAEGVAAWADVPRPLIGAHVRVGDGCWDSKRGGCKYVKAFSDIVDAVRASGIKNGTIFLATDNATIAGQALAAPPDGFVLATLREDRLKVQKSHGKREPDKMFHLQILDLALLSQTDVLVGVFGSTFIKTALQFGHAREYVSLDTFHWCPLLRCYWLWADLCHNCDMCPNLGGAGEACASGIFHTPNGLLPSMRRGGVARSAYRTFVNSVMPTSQCRPWALHPLGRAAGRPKAQWPVVGSFYAPPLPSPPPQRECIVRGVSAQEADSCSCGFQRYFGVDNAAAQRRKPAFGYGIAPVPLASPSLPACERACCDEPLCHSVVWSNKSRTCTASLALAHGARLSDWCWHPEEAVDAVSSLRLPGPWEERAVQLATEVLNARVLLRSGSEPGPRTFSKRWSVAQHYGLQDHAVRATSCNLEPETSAQKVTVSSLAMAALPKKESNIRCKNLS